MTNRYPYNNNSIAYPFSWVQSIFLFLWKIVIFPIQFKNLPPCCISNWHAHKKNQTFFQKAPKSIFQLLGLVVLEMSIFLLGPTFELCHVMTILYSSTIIQFNLPSCLWELIIFTSIHVAVLLGTENSLCEVPPNYSFCILVYINFKYWNVHLFILLEQKIINIRIWSVRIMGV